MEKVIVSSIKSVYGYSVNIAFATPTLTSSISISVYLPIGIS